MSNTGRSAGSFWSREPLPASHTWGGRDEDEDEDQKENKKIGKKNETQKKEEKKKKN